MSLERQRVVTRDVSDDVMVLHSLTRRYRRGLRRVTAVDNLSVGVPRGEVRRPGVSGVGPGVTCPIGLRARLTRVNGAQPVDPCPIDRPRVPIDRGKPPNASPVVPRGNWQACSPLPCLWGTAC